jgi:acetate kinase
MNTIKNMVSEDMDSTVHFTAMLLKEQSLEELKIITFHLGNGPLLLLLKTTNQ